LPGAIIELTTSLKVSPHQREKCAKWKLDLKSTLIPRKGEMTVRRAFQKFQTFLYALIYTAVRSLRSDSGQSMSGAENEKREGMHIEMTFSL